jgi:hypothetical protein
MRIAYFPNYAALNSGPILDAVLQGCKTQGVTTVADSMDADAAIIWSVLWHGRMQSNKKIYEHYKSLNKPVIIVEVGALHRNITWKIAVNNITAQGYYGHYDNLDWDRPKKLNIKLSNQLTTNPKIIVALQHARSLQVESISDIATWATETVTALQQVTDRPVVVRPHPRSKIVLPLNIKLELPNKLNNTYDSFDMNYDCHAIVNYNSGVGIQAAINGVRPVVDSSSLAAPIGIALADIEKPYTVDRDLWLVQICHTEYTIEEIQKGLWLKRTNIIQ